MRSEWFENCNSVQRGWFVVNGKREFSNVPNTGDSSILVCYTVSTGSSIMPPFLRSLKTEALIILKRFIIIIIAFSQIESKLMCFERKILRKFLAP
jgi:hypothetical protein